MMEDYKSVNSMSSGVGGGGTMDFSPSPVFSRNSPQTEQTVVFGRAAAGIAPVTTASGAANKRGRERPRSPSPNFNKPSPEASPPLARMSPEDPGRMSSRSPPDQHQREEEAAKLRRLVRFGNDRPKGVAASRAVRGMAEEDERLQSSKISPLAAGFGMAPSEAKGNVGLPGGNAKWQRDLSQAGRSSENLAVDNLMETDGPDNFSSSEALLGLCPDMCPEVERDERERKGDLDRFERLGGNRNQTSRDLAVKKYTRTAEKDAILIRPLPVLRNTMLHLLSLLERNHEDDLLVVHSFLWDRMRAVRMDLRMQHIFNTDAITMHEQMIRFHILAMHELCEFSQGEGISEVFNAHLNIEQMNKTSVDLFQMYDDHSKRGNPVPTEAEFRGYYALLKLDKHPGYRVEPAELSLDLAKMTNETRNSTQVRFARDVARACRANKYVTFFKLAQNATYLQACLMHAHFSKLRTQALGSLHSALQKNQGLPLSSIVNWLGMEGEDIEALIEYHGFSMKYYEEPYMVKEGPFLNKNQDFPTHRSQLVIGKRSLRLVMDVQSERQVQETTQSLSEERRISVPGRKGILERKRAPGLEDHKGIPIPTSPDTFVNTKEEEMPDYVDSLEEETDGLEEVTLRPVIMAREILVDEGKQSRKRHMEEVQFEAEEHERRRLRHEADAAGRRAASQALALEIKRQEELLRLAVHKAEADAGIQARWFRRWRRRVAAKALERHQKLLQNKAAVEALSLGFPVGKLCLKAPGASLSFVQRHEYIEDLLGEQGLALQEMWEPLDIVGLVGPILQELNPAAGVLCWKLLLSTPDTLSGMWIRNKVSSRLKSVTRKNSGVQSSSSTTSMEDSFNLTGNKQCSIIDFWYHAGSADSTGTTLCPAVASPGIGGLLFVMNEDESVPVEQSRLHSIVQALPEGVRVPLLVLSTKLRSTIGIELPDLANWERMLRLDELSTSKVCDHQIISISASKTCDRAFFSSAALKEGLIWLAKLCPIQPHLRSLHVADLVSEHVDSHLKLLLRMPLPEVNPEHLIKLFNEGLHNAAKIIGSMASGVPSYWNSKETLESIFSDLESCLLPLFPPFNSSSGSNLADQKLRLEQTLAQFLTLVEGTSTAIKWEVSRIMQRGCTIEWSASGRKLVPKWVQIFRGIFASRLLLLNLKPSPLLYVAEASSSRPKFNNGERLYDMTRPNVSCDGQPLLDEMIDEEHYTHCSADEELPPEDEEVLTHVAEAVSQGSIQGDSSTQMGFLEPLSSPQSTGSAWPGNKESQPQSSELASTPSELLLDKLMAEFKQTESSPQEKVPRKGVEGVMFSHEGHNLFRERIRSKSSEQGPVAIDQVSDMRLQLPLTHFEILLDEMVQEFRKKEFEGSQECILKAPFSSSGLEVL